MNQLAHTNSSNLTDYDSERTLISCTREDTDESYKIFAKAIELGITADHFSDESMRQYWKCFCDAESVGDYGDIGAQIRLPKGFQSQYPHFTDEILLCHDIASEHKSTSAIAGILRSYHFRKLDSISQRLSMEILDSEGLADPITLAHKAEQELQKIIIPKSSTLSDSDQLSEGTILMIDEAINQGPARIAPHLPWLRYGLDGGFKNSQMTVVAARPGVGKTTITKLNKPIKIINKELQTNPINRDIFIKESDVELDFDSINARSYRPLNTVAAIVP